MWYVLCRADVVHAYRAMLPCGCCMRCLRVVGNLRRLFHCSVGFTQTFMHSKVYSVVVAGLTEVSRGMFYLNADYSNGETSP